MEYAQIVESRGKLPDLEGRLVLALYADYGSVALLLDDSQAICFVTDEVVIGRWFEVFPIQISNTSSPEVRWMHLTMPFSVRHVDYLWREEWQESLADEGAVTDKAPHHAQFSMPLESAPVTAEEVVKVCAGVRMRTADEQLLVICTSSSNPFGMNIAMHPRACEAILKEHTCV